MVIERLVRDEPDLYSYEYILDMLNRKIKQEISTHIYYREKRWPTRDEYERLFKNLKEDIECKVTRRDLGIFDD